MTNYISHNIILTSLERNFKSKTFNEEDVLNWCQEVETLYVADPDAMAKYLEIPLKVVSKRNVALPSNIYKLLDVYEDVNDYESRVTYRRMPGSLKLNRDVKDTVYVNYIGTPLDKDCMPLIAATHQSACETYCKINAFEEEVLNGNINQNLYFDWKQRFDGMIQSVKGDVSSWTRDDWAKMTIIMGNKIPRIGYMTLAHKEIFEASPENPTESVTLQGYGSATVQ